MHNGWIKLHRKLLEKGWMNNSKYVHLWVFLLLSANHAPKEFMWNNKIIIVKEGQLITGRKELAKKTGINRSSVDRILKFFENEHQIEQQMTTKFRLITVLNWKSHQENEQQNEPQVSIKRATSEHKQECKNTKNERNNNTEQKNEIQKIMDIFYKYNPALNFGNKTERASVEWILNKWGFDESQRMVEYAMSIQGKDFAPVITTPYEFKNKIAKIKLFKDKQDKPRLSIIG